MADILLQIYCSRQEHFFSGTEQKDLSVSAYKDIGEICYNSLRYFGRRQRSLGFKTTDTLSMAY